jgi:high-affinity nickel permease
MIQQVAALGLLGTGLALGLRHGIDWDHIAAIADIASSTTSEDAASGGRGTPARFSLRRPELSASRRSRSRPSCRTGSTR